MQDKRKRNLQRRRQKLIFIASCSGTAISAVIIGVFFSVVAGFGKWPDPWRTGYPVQDMVSRAEQTQEEGQTAQPPDRQPPEQSQPELSEGTIPFGETKQEAASGQQELAGQTNSEAASGQMNSEEASGQMNSEEASGQMNSEEASGQTDSEPSAGTEGTKEAGQTELAASEEEAGQTELAASEEEADSTAAAIAVAVGEVNSVYVKLVAVGDNLVHRSVSMSGLQADGSYNYSYNFSKVADIVRDADLAVINQEAVVGGNELGILGYPCFNCRTEMADELVRTGFDVVLGANNHILDQGAEGVRHMIRYFQTNYPQIELLGLHDSWETRDQISIVECKGIRIAMINYTDLLNIPSAWQGQEYLTDYLDYDRLAALIRQAKESSDFVIVFPHWGTEYNLGIDAKQQEEAAFLAAQGVDLVIGTHPHVVEPVQYMTRPDGGKMLIYYSLGNYQSIQNQEATLIGGMAEVVIKKNYAGTSVSDFNMKFLATDFRMSPGFRDYYDIVTTYPWEQYSRELAQSSWVFHDNPGFQVDDMFRLQAQMEAQVAAERQAAGMK